MPRRRPQTRRIRVNPWRPHRTDRNGRRYSVRQRGPGNYLRGWVIVIGAGALVVVVVQEMF